MTTRESTADALPASVPAPDALAAFPHCVPEPAAVSRLVESGGRLPLRRMRRRRAVIGALDEIGPTLAGEAGTRMRRSFPRGDHHGAEAGYSGGVAVAAALLAVLAFERRDLTA